MKKIKLRDIVPELWERKEHNFFCRHHICTSCPLSMVDCVFWVNYKDMYSDKFLDQEIEVEE